jgi:hypothetical protein
MATIRFNVSANVTPAVTLSNPLSLDELQLLGAPTVTIGNTAEASGVLGTEEGFNFIIEPNNDPADSVGANGAAVLAALAKANQITTAAGKNVSIILMPGYYDLKGETITITRAYTNIVGFVGNPNAVIVANDGSSYSIDVRVDNVSVSGITLTGGFYAETNTSAATNIVVRNCILGKPNDPGIIGFLGLYATFDNCWISTLESAGPAAPGAPAGIVFQRRVTRCRIFGSGDFYLGNGSTIEHSTLEVDTGDIIGVGNIKLYLSAYNKVLAGLATNDIGTPYNVVDSDIKAY